MSNVLVVATVFHSSPLNGGFDIDTSHLHSYCFDPCYPTEFVFGPVGWRGLPQSHPICATEILSHDTLLLEEEQTLFSIGSPATLLFFQNLLLVPEMLQLW
jgi:hypothetical protein